MFVETFLKMFPPPAFLAMPYAGLDISDDSIHCLTYGSTFGRTRVKSFARASLPEGLMDGGDTKDATKLTAEIAKFAKKNRLSYVRVSIPEEKAYLFQTDVPLTDIKSIRQNIESKLEENVPLSAADALFYFDLIPPQVDGGSLRASVSVVPRTYIQHMTSILHDAGLTPVAFEVVPRALARVVTKDNETIMVAHIMKEKTGIYIVSDGSVCFTSTLNNHKILDSRLSDVEVIKQEIARINEYWLSRPDMVPIGRVVLVGHDALKYEKELGGTLNDPAVPVSVPNVWQTVCGATYLCPVPREQSLSYAVSAGLAIPS